jgi:hypothetical protein
LQFDFLVKKPLRWFTVVVIVAADRTSSASSSLSLGSIVPTLVIDGLCPFLVYVLLRRYAPGISEIMALGAGAVFPVGRSVIELRHRRGVDIIGIIVLVGIAAGIAALLAGGSPKLLLIRESFVTGALAVLALTSFAWRRPLMFYIGRQFSAGRDPAAVEQFDGLWQHPGARRAFRVMTMVWAVGWLSEFALRIVMVINLPVAQVLAISPIVFNAITFALILWTVTYAQRRQRRSARLNSTERSDHQR